MERPIPDKELRNYEKVPLKENINEYFSREVIPYTPNAWIDREKDKIGYEINLNNYFYQYESPRGLHTVTKEIIEKENEIQQYFNGNPIIRSTQSYIDLESVLFGVDGKYNPSNWEKIKAKWVFREVANKGYPDEPLLAVTQHAGVVPRDSLEYQVMNPGGNLDSYKLVTPGDFIISLRTFQGGIELSQIRGIVSPAYTILKPVRDICGNYFKYYFKSHYFISLLQSKMTGIRDGKSVPCEDFGQIELSLPHISVQNAIAKFLDQELAIIDSLIAVRRYIQEWSPPEYRYQAISGLIQQDKLPQVTDLLGWLTEDSNKVRVYDSDSFNINGVEKSTVLIKEQVQKLQEFRTALISEAVTGKIDVRLLG